MKYTTHQVLTIFVFHSEDQGLILSQQIIHMVVIFGYHLEVTVTIVTDERQRAGVFFKSIYHKNHYVIRLYNAPLTPQ
jgi:hypothetical protein